MRTKKTWKVRVITSLDSEAATKGARECFLNPHAGASSTGVQARTPPTQGGSGEGRGDAPEGPALYRTLQPSQTGPPGTRRDAGRARPLPPSPRGGVTGAGGQARPPPPQGGQGGGQRDTLEGPALYRTLQPSQTGPPGTRRDAGRARPLPPSPRGGVTGAGGQARPPPPGRAGGGPERHPGGASSLDLASQFGPPETWGACGGAHPLHAVANVQLRDTRGGGHPSANTREARGARIA